MLTRRYFLAAGASAASLGLPLLAKAADPGATALPTSGGDGSLPINVGSTKDGKVSFPPTNQPTEPPSQGPPNPNPPNRRVGFAVVGLGKLSLEQILPAFAQSKKAKLAALVSGTPDKLKTIAAQYGVDGTHCYSYDKFDKISVSKNIECVYIVLPNSLHKEFTLRAAEAGKHVLCEKPMATSVAEAKDMIKACQDANVKLMIAYRMQYEKNTREVMRLIATKELGAVQAISAFNVQAESDPQQWRLKRELSGGGSLPDIGLYCLNTVRALLGEEPIEIMAMQTSPKDDPRFASVEDNISFVMRFPSGVIANCLSSYSAHENRSYTVLGESGWVTVDGAFGYEGQQTRVGKREGDHETIDQIKIPRQNQFASELDHMAECILQNRIPRTPGEEGLQDQALMEAIYRASSTHQPVSLDRVTKRDITRGPALEEEKPPS